MKAVLREGALLQIIKGSQIKNLLIQLKALERSKKKSPTQNHLTEGNNWDKRRKNRGNTKNQWNKDFFEKMNKISWLLAKWIQERKDKPNE